MLIAAGASLVIHAAMFSAFPRYEVGGVAVDWRENDRHRTEEMKIVLEAETEPAPDPEPEDTPEFAMGANDASGYASNEVPDKLETMAREAESDQAFLSLDAVGAGDEGADASLTEATGAGSTIGQPGASPPPIVVEIVADPGTASSPPLTGINPEIPSPPEVVESLPDEAPLAIPAPEDLPAEGGEEVVEPPVEAPPAPDPATPIAPVEAEAIAVPEPSKPAVEPVPTPQDGGTRAGASPSAAADPARMSDSESDPFSRLGTAIVRDGRLDIRFGRKVKTRRPKLLLAAQVDLWTLRRAQVVLTIDIDETGKVTSVKIAKSSGSNDIDQPTKVAVYDWWFEPKKDPEGQPIADQVEFTINWR